jgi:hypothetical protein
MRLHTTLTAEEVRAALRRAQDKGRVTADVEFTTFGDYPSRTHGHSFEVQLGTHDKHSLPEGYVDQHGKKMQVRRYKNSGTNGASQFYSATWHEWGWFVVEVFAADPHARFGNDPERSRHPWGYFSPEDFHEKTGFKFR